MLIEIPYWWNKNLLSLAATIYQYRKDPILSTSIGTEPIPVEPPGGLIEGNEYIF